MKMNCLDQYIVRYLNNNLVISYVKVEGLDSLFISRFK